MQIAFRVKGQRTNVTRIYRHFYALV